MMKSMFKIWRYLIATAVLILIGVGLWLWKSASNREPADKIEIAPARMVELRAVANLCETEIFREETVVDTLGDKVIFGVWKVKGRILYDLNDLPEKIEAANKEMAASADTLRISLPKERIELLEATGPGAWRVVDTYSLRLFGSDRFTPEEENRVKSRALQRIRRKLYNDGTVATSRREAAATLQRMLEPILNRPVLISQ